MLVPSAQRVKHPLARRVSDAFALEKLTDGRVVDHSHGVLDDLNLKMEIPDHPAEAGGISSVPHSALGNPQTRACPIKAPLAHDRYFG